MRQIETEHAKALHQWLTLMRLPHTHIANEGTGGRAGMIRQGKLKAMGVSKGFPDFIILLPTAWTNSQPLNVAIELKRPDGGHLAPEQARWLNILASYGWKTCVAHGWQEAKDFIEGLHEKETKAERF